jgi:hypothetical protein
MARLSHSGSTRDLRLALFPIGFAGEVMVHLLETWRTLCLQRQVSKETAITAVFRDALINAYVAAGRSWFITLEDPITELDFGTETGRNDLRFYPPNHYGQSIFFTVECKRLRVVGESGLRHLADKYAEEGIQRFVDGRYSKGLPCGGMVGYVMDNQTELAFASMQAEILSKTRRALKVPAREGIRVPSAVLPDYEWSADTFHNRRDCKFLVHHLLVGVSN